MMSCENSVLHYGKKELNIVQSIVKFSILTYMLRSMFPNEINEAT